MAMQAVFFCSRGYGTFLHQRLRDVPLSSQAVCEYLILYFDKQT